MRCSDADRLGGAVYAMRPIGYGSMPTRSATALRSEGADVLLRRPALTLRSTMKSTVDAPDWSTIPAPVDDGAIRHLSGGRLPSVLLPATSGETVDLSALRDRVVVYAYPRTGRPGVENPDGWDMIPGARGSLIWSLDPRSVPDRNALAATATVKRLRPAPIGPAHNPLWP